MTAEAGVARQRPGRIVISTNPIKSKETCVLNTPRQLRLGDQLEPHPGRQGRVAGALPIGGSIRAVELTGG